VSETAIAFEGANRIARGDLATVVLQAKAALDLDPNTSILIFEGRTSALVEVDFRGSRDEVLARLAASEARDEQGAPRRGRPKLGVTAREVTLLPRHWDWLGRQPGGASATLRKLVEQARREDTADETIREARDALYRFATVMAGDAPGYEEALRALFAGDAERFSRATTAWPSDVREHAWKLAPRAFGFPPSPLDAAIPFDRRGAVQRAVQAAFPQAEITAVAPVLGGASAARVFRLTVDGGDRLLRVEGAVDAIRNPTRQYACLRIAAEAGVAPSLIYADAQDGVAITDFITPFPPGHGPARGDRLCALAAAVRTLHAAPLFPPLVDIFEGIGAGIAQMGVAQALPQASQDLMARLHGELARAYPRRDQDRVSSHNDLNPGNVLFEGDRAWIVDWESAFAADRYMDLAAIANWFASDEREEELILQAYFGAAPDDDCRARLFIMQQANRLFYAAMLLNAAAAERPGFRVAAANLHALRLDEIRAEMASMASFDGRVRFAQAFLNAAAHDFESARFAWAKAHLRA
jgi:aminoglycoside phosphotransferase (APT) family kinase protein